MSFATRVFRIAGIYGLIVLVPQYFLEAHVGRTSPPPITHPEYYYGFIGVALAWQIAFFLISSDPVRYRPLMVAAILEKATFSVATVVLFAAGRLSAQMLGAGLLDMLLGILFMIAYVRTPSQVREPSRARV
jgi:hypothetical protein